MVVQKFLKGSGVWDWSNTEGSTASSDSVSKASKKEIETLPDVEQITTHATQTSIAAACLSADHQQYLIDRHGTLDLDPMPGFGNADPYNWPKWKKTSNLILVAWHAAMSTVTAGAIIPAYSVIAADLGVTLQQASYLTSIQIAIVGVAPFFWKPLSNRYGRRPVFLISLICSLLGNIGCAESPSYSSLAVCRAIVAFFISPAGAIGSVVVAETFFKRQRAYYLGIWTLLVTIGVPIGPFIFSFVTQYLGYRWIFWILAMINAAQFLLYLFLGPETRYLRKGIYHEGSDFKQEYLRIFTRIDPKPFRAVEFIQPLFLARHAFILVPTAAYAMTFLFGSVLISVEIPQLFQEKFALDAQQIGLQFLALIIGSVIGEQLGGVLSDFWMTRRENKISRKPAPEYRLWLSYTGFILTIVGVIVFFVQIQNAQDGVWNITPLIGVAIAATGNQIVTTVLITYSIDSLNIEEAASVGVFITFVRQIWGFIGPFWFPSMFANIGLVASAGVACALLVGVSILPTILLQWRGAKWRASATNST